MLVRTPGRAKSNVAFFVLLTGHTASLRDSSTMANYILHVDSDKRSSCSQTYFTLGCLKTHSIKIRVALSCPRWALPGEGSYCVATSLLKGSVCSEIWRLNARVPHHAKSGVIHALTREITHTTLSERVKTRSFKPSKEYKYASHKDQSPKGKSWSPIDTHFPNKIFEIIFKSIGNSTVLSCKANVSPNK